MQVAVAATPFNGKDLRSLQFFQEQTLSQMNLFFPSTFWGELLPQVAEAETSIRHALCAMSGFHEHFVLKGKEGSNESRYALQQYNLSIRKLLDSRTYQENPVIGLFCCLIFISIELLQGKIVPAMQLFRSGRKMVYELRNSPAKINSTLSSQDLYTVLKAAFMRLEFQMALLGRSVDPDLPFVTCFGEQIRDPRPVTVLKSVSEAFECHAEATECWVIALWSGHVDYPLYRERLQQWRSAFEDLLRTSNDSFTVKDRRGAAWLKALTKQYELSLLVAENPPKSIAGSLWWDNKMPYFADIIGNLEYALEIDEGMESLPPCFSLDAGINTHLYTTAIRCRDPVLRRRALAVMRTANRYEGIMRWDITVEVLERIIELEEEGLGNVQSCSDIPEEARLNDFNIFLDPTEMKAIVRYVVRGKVTDEVISWKNPTV